MCMCVCARAIESESGYTVHVVLIVFQMKYAASRINQRNKLLFFFSFFSFFSHFIRNACTLDEVAHIILAQRLQ